MVRAESAARQHRSFKLVIDSGENKTSDIPCIELWKNHSHGSLRLPTITTSSAPWIRLENCPHRYKFTYVLERDLVPFTAWCSPSCSEV